MTSKHRRALVSARRQNAPRFDEQTRCPNCRRWHLRRQACLWCQPPLPESCGDPHEVAREHEAEPRLWWHRHLDHQLLQLWWVMNVEDLDESLLQPSTSEEAPPRAHWKKAEDLQPHLAQNPQVLVLMDREGVEGVYRAAGLTEQEIDVFTLRSAGWTNEAVAHLKGWLVDTVADFYNSGLSALRTRVHVSGGDAPARELEPPILRLLNTATPSGLSHSARGLRVVADSK